MFLNKNNFIDNDNFYKKTFFLNEAVNFFPKIKIYKLKVSKYMYTKCNFIYQ